MKAMRSLRLLAVGALVLMGRLANADNSGLTSGLDHLVARKTVSTMLMTNQNANAPISRAVAELVSQMGGKATVDSNEIDAELDWSTSMQLDPTSTELPEPEAIRIATEFANARVLPNLDRIPGEALELVAIKRQLRGVSAANGGSPTVSRVVAKHVIFRRVVAGLPIVSDRAAIRVVLGNDGQPRSLALHWLQVSAKLMESAVPARLPGAIQEKVTAMAGPNGTATIQALDCGYLDTALAETRNGALALGCTAHVTGLYVLNGRTFAHAKRFVVGANAPAGPAPSHGRSEAQQ